MNLQDPMSSFIQECRAKDAKGCIEHRNGDTSAPFVGDLCDEYEQEQTDSANYLLRMLDRGDISYAEYSLGLQRHMEAWWWSKVNVRKNRR